MEILGNRRKGRLEELARQAENDPVFKEIFEEKQESKVETKGDEILMFAEDYTMNAMWGKDVLLIGKKTSIIRAMAMYKGGVVAAGDEGIIYDSFSGDVVKFCSRSVLAMCNVGEKLYLAMNSDKESLIFQLPQNIAVDRLKQRITALCKHKGQFYYGTEIGNIVNAKKNEIVYLGDNQKNSANALCSYKNVLYCSVFDKIFSICSDHYYDLIAVRPGNVSSLCIFNGKLHDAGSYGIYETLTNVPVRKNIGVYALCSAPKSLLEEYLGLLTNKIKNGN